MKVGFTGTRSDCTDEQRRALYGWFKTHLIRMKEFHHGCCLGADQTASEWFDSAKGMKVVAHPSNLRRWTSSLGLMFADQTMPKLPPLDRNRNIVNVTDLLLACPKGPEQFKGSGTWATIRYARKVGKKVIIFHPDGKVEEV